MSISSNFKLGPGHPFQAPDGTVVNGQSKLRPWKRRVRKSAITPDAVQLDLWRVLVLVGRLDSWNSAARAVVALIELAGVAEMERLHEGCPSLLGDQGHGRLVDQLPADQPGVAAGVEEDGVVALAELGHHEIHEVDVPASSEGDDDPFQQRLRGIGNLLIVVATVDVKGHGQHGLEGGGPIVEALLLNGIFTTRLGQAGHGGGEGRGQEAEDAHVEDELPPEASAHDAEHGELDVQVD